MTFTAGGLDLALCGKWGGRYSRNSNSPFLTARDSKYKSSNMQILFFRAKDAVLKIVWLQNQNAVGLGPRYGGLREFVIFQRKNPSSVFMTTLTKYKIFFFLLSCNGIEGNLDQYSSGINNKQKNTLSKVQDKTIHTWHTIALQFGGGEDIMAMQILQKHI